MNWPLTIAATPARPAAVEAALMDEADFTAFHARTARALWAYLARASGNHALADDLTQESFFRFLRAGRWAEGEVACRSYLFTIATNLLRDYWRRPKTSDIEALPEAALAHDGGMNPARMAEQWDREATLGPALGQLRPRQRQMLWLAYVEGYSHREIAAILGLSAPSIRLLLFRARRRLADLLGRAPEGEP